jgi:hypothetical protein
MTHTLGCISTEMSLHVLAYNFERIIRVLGFAKAMRSIKLAGA